jgi:hypothetical protein
MSRFARDQVELADHGFPLYSRSFAYPFQGAAGHPRLFHRGVLRQSSIRQRGERSDLSCLSYIQVTVTLHPSYIQVTAPGKAPPTPIWTRGGGGVCPLLGTSPSHIPQIPRCNLPITQRILDNHPKPIQSLLWHYLPPRRAKRGVGLPPSFADATHHKGCGAQKMHHNTIKSLISLLNSSHGTWACRISPPVPMMLFPDKKILHFPMVTR